MSTTAITASTKSQMHRHTGCMEYEEYKGKALLCDRGSSAHNLLDYPFEKWHGNLSERSHKAESMLIALADVLLASVEIPVLIKDD